MISYLDCRTEKARLDKVKSNINKSLIIRTTSNSVHVFDNGINCILDLENFRGLPEKLSNKLMVGRISLLCEALCARIPDYIVLSREEIYVIEAIPTCRCAGTFLCFTCRNNFNRESGISNEEFFSIVSNLQESDISVFSATMNVSGVLQKNQLVDHVTGNQELVPLLSAILPKVSLEMINKNYIETLMNILTFDSLSSDL